MGSVPAHLLKWITPDETASQFLKRQAAEAVPTGLPFIDSHVILRPGSVLEIVGPSGSAKSEILIQVVRVWRCRLCRIVKHPAATLTPSWLRWQAALNILLRSHGPVGSVGAEPGDNSSPLCC